MPYSRKECSPCPTVRDEDARTMHRKKWGGYFKEGPLYCHDALAGHDPVQHP
jgi:hypothetical protein